MSRSVSIILKRRAFVLVAFFLFAPAIFFLSSGGEAKQPQTQQAKARRALIISMDGLDARYLNRRDEFGLKIPNLRRLMAEGAAARGVVSIFPSVTYPAHATIVTGTRPIKHGIFGNDLLEPPPGTFRGSREWYWYARDIRAETLWDAARKRGMKVGMVSWPVGVGAGDYNVPEIVRFGGSLLDTLARMRENTRPQGLLEEIEKRDKQLYARASRDEQDDMRTRMAEHIITEKRPELLFVHLLDLDRSQHDKGPFTPDSFAILEKLDAYLGRILDAARRAGTLNETAVFVVSDHGFLPVSKLVHPGVMLERAGLLKVREERDEKGNAVTTVTEWRALPYVTNGSCAIILRDENDKDALKLVRDLFRPLARREGSGIREVIEGRRLNVLGANNRVALMLDGADGFAFGENFAGEVITPSKDKGAHGFAPDREDYYASFIAAGPGVKRRQLGIVQMTDIGPTIAATLGLTLKDAYGQVSVLP
ncbi:MAG TPA: ectonucleotide pyrophosphatase/phosphodiesterase [Pyrinomonadaceae bacterium]|nr:ectonucleotide pyrophosphatase/phosphodiesterase [Pyrinomonadaceae bacterium]